MAKSRSDTASSDLKAQYAWHVDGGRDEFRSFAESRERLVFRVARLELGDR